MRCGLSAVNDKRFKGRPSIPDSNPQTSVVQIQASAFSGPLPPPELLAKYNDVIPNGAERIMAMAERQSSHRERLEYRVVDGGVANSDKRILFRFHPQSRGYRRRIFPNRTRQER